MIKLCSYIILMSVFMRTSIAQNYMHPLSYTAHKNTYDDDRNAFSFYRLRKNSSGYLLTTKRNQVIFKEPFDTIVKNQHFIKALKGGSISLYRTQNLAPIVIPNLRQVYFKQDGLEVLTDYGGYYLNNDLESIESFPEIEAFSCGVVFEKRYHISKTKDTKKPCIIIESGHSGDMISHKELIFKGLPEAYDTISFVNNSNYISVSANNTIVQYPHLIKVVESNSCRLYAYNINEAIYYNTQEADTPLEFNITTLGDTIYTPVMPEIIELEVLQEKGEITLIEVLPKVYDRIYQNQENGMIYIQREGNTSFYPDHRNSQFSNFQKQTDSFYSILKMGKKGWLDIKTFKEYY